MTLYAGLIDGKEAFWVISGRDRVFLSPAVCRYLIRWRGAKMRRA